MKERINKFGAKLVEGISNYETLAVKYKINISEILQIDLNRCGIYLKNGEVKEGYRARFKAKLLDDFESWYALPVMGSADTNFSIEGNIVYCLDEPIGTLTTSVLLDTCESSYQRGPNLLNLNSRSRSMCGGCKACIHNYHDFYDSTVIKDKKQLISVEDIDNFMTQSRIDMSKLVQIAVVTGLFGSEERVLDHLHCIKEVGNKRNFRGQLMYFGCELNSDHSMDALSKIGNTEIVYALDNFTQREIILSKKKSLITMDMAKNTLDKAKDRNIKTTISYICGIDKLEELEQGFKYLKHSCTEFPIVNIYQIQTLEQAKILNQEATSLEYYLKSRQIIERIFIDTRLRPKRWSNYRPLWYRYFANEELPDNAFGQKEILEDEQW